MAKAENDLDICYSQENANTSRQETDIAEIIRKRNALGWELVSISTAIVDTSNQFSNLYLFCRLLSLYSQSGRYFLRSSSILSFGKF